MLQELPRPLLLQRVAVVSVGGAAHTSGVHCLQHAVGHPAQSLRSSWCTRCRPERRRCCWRRCPDLKGCGVPGLNITFPYQGCQLLNIGNFSPYGQGNLTAVTGPAVPFLAGAQNCVLAQRCLRLVAVQKIGFWKVARLVGPEQQGRAWPAASRQWPWGAAALLSGTSHNSWPHSRTTLWRRGRCVSHRWGYFGL